MPDSTKEEGSVEGRAEALLPPVIGAKLMSVTFQPGLVTMELRRAEEDGNILRWTLEIENHIMIIEADRNFGAGQLGQHDAICARIGKRIATLSTTHGEALSITFDDGAVVVVSLRREDFGKRTAARLYAPDNQFASWALDGLAWGVYSSRQRRR